MPNGTEFSYVIFPEQWNFTTAERRNGNGRTATEWWKPGINLPHRTNRNLRMAEQKRKLLSEHEKNESNP